MPDAAGAAEDVRETLERITDPVVALDLEWRFTYVNDAAARVLGFSAGDLLGRNIWTDLPDALEASFPDACRRAMTERVSGQAELSLPPNGRRFVCRLYPSDSGLSIFFHDDTKADTLEKAEEARRRAEIEYQTIFHHAPVGIFQATVEGKFLRVNPALAQIGGYASPEAQRQALTNLGDQMYVHPERHEELKRLLRETGRVTDFESQVYRQDGSVIWISERARAVRDDAGGFLYYECFVEDITDRKARDEARERILDDALERADRDPLTGLLNHRAFYKRLEAETARAGREGAALAVAVLDLDNFKFFNDVYGHTVGDEVLKEVAQRLGALCRRYDVVARFGGDEFALLLGGIGTAQRQDIEARLKAGTVGMSFQPPNGEAAVPLSVSVGVAVFPTHSAERLEVIRIADERLRRAKTGAEADGEAGHLRAGLLQSVEGFSLLDALVTAVDNKDRYTRRHSEDVMTLCLRIARAMGLPQAEQDALAIGALLHDVGKIGVPDAILRKPGRLTGEEFEAVKQHPQMGAIIVAAVPGMEQALDAIRHHHERWDGGGYPTGLAGEQIPFIARLMAVADAYSAMTADRPYRKGHSRPDALAVLQDGAGTQWDPAFVNALKRVLV